MRSPSSPCTATRRPQLRPTAIPPREARATLMVRAHASRAPLPTPSARKADSRVDGPRTSRARRCPPPRRPRAPLPTSFARGWHVPLFRRPQPRRLCAVCSRNASVLPNVSRETFVPISHYIATIVSRETISASAMATNEREVPFERRRPRQTRLRSERGAFFSQYFPDCYHGTTVRKSSRSVSLGREGNR